MSNDTTAINGFLSAKIRRTLKGAMARVLMTVCFQASAMHATAQESAEPQTQTQDVALELSLDAPRFASRGSVEQLGRRGRWMTSWGAASLGVGAGLLVGVGASFASCARSSTCDHFTGVGMMMAGGALAITGAILTPLGVKRMRWSRSQREGEIEVSLTPTGVVLRGTF
jgi:hypothetical protein